MESRSNARHCQSIRHSFDCFVQGWKQFHEANHGQIPIECQAGRAAIGLEAEQTRLATIQGDGKELPLRFFLSDADAKGQPQLVAEYLCRIWNEVVDAAIKALSHMQKGHTANWAAQMRRAAPVWLADLFFQARSVQRYLCRQDPNAESRVTRPHNRALEDHFRKEKRDG